MKFEDAMMITVTVITDDPDQAIKAGEVLSRAVIGLMLEGIPSVGFNITKGVDPDELGPNIDIPYRDDE